MRFIPDPSYPAQREGGAERDPEGLSDNKQLGVVLAELAPYWCVTCDIDPHYASIGAGPDAIDRLVADPRVDVVDDPDREPPYYS